MLKVCHVVNELAIGGGTVHIAQSVRDLVALGYPCAVATLQDGPMREKIEGWGGKVFLMNKEEDLYEVYNEFRPHVFHGHSCGGGHFPCAVTRVLQSQGEKLISGEHVHSIVPGTNPNADFEIAEVEMMRDLRPGITIIPWSYDLSRLQSKLTKEEAKEKLGIPHDAFVIGRNGRLDGAKRPDVFVDVLNSLPNVWGLLYGDGPEFGSLRELSIRLGCSDRLVMPGSCFDPADRFAAMDVIVYPTQDESWCAGIIEPMLIGKPVVANIVGGMGENLIHGQTGFVANTPNEFIDKITYIRNDYKEALRLAKNGQEHLYAKGVHDPVLEAKRHLALYEEVYRRKYKKLPR